MIIEVIFNLLRGIIFLFTLPFNLLPNTPQALIDAMDYYLDLVFSNLDFISFFVNVGTLKAVAIVAIAIWTLDESYHLLLWIIRKLPLSIN